jgi:hypothetical protein
MGQPSISIRDLRPGDARIMSPLGHSRKENCVSGLHDLLGGSHRHFRKMLFSAVEVQAEGLYEASVLGICAFRKHELTPAGLTELEIEVRSSVTHTLTVRKVQDWLQRGVRTPKEVVLKERLRSLLA